MVDFGSLIDEVEGHGEINPREIFESLPKSSQINNLYDTQAEILRKWYEELRNRDNVVIELNTGGGKTLVGLLIALSTMRETEEGVLYLVESKQLVNQVVDQANQIGIPVKAYSGRSCLDADFYNGDVIVVGTYQALFNGKSVFGVLEGGQAPVRLGGIIIDDAHASLGALKQAFTLVIPSEGNQSFYKSVLAEFRSAFKAIDRLTTYNEFFDGIGNAVIEIPYEYWINSIERVSKMITNEWAVRKDEKSVFGEALLFSWPLIKDNLKYCQVTVSRNSISISALYPLLYMIPSFNNAKRRVFMSATITDYGDMVRTYDLRGLKKEDIIFLKTSSGVGRRMVLMPSVDILDSNEFKSLVENELSVGHGIVRLAPRSGMEFPWFETDEIVGHDKVDAAVKRLQNGATAKAVSLINRYNGIDLPEDACRILVLHDLPSNYDDIDALMSTYLSDSDIFSQRIAQRIEQGVGRGVRGASDHCVILLVGHRLTEWMKQKRNRKHFSPSFRVQLEMGETIGGQIFSPQIFCETLRKDIDSDDEWKRVHAARLAKEPPRDIEECFGLSFEGACLERRVFAKWTERHNEEAYSKIEKDAEKFENDSLYRGWLLSIASKIAFDGDSRHKASLLLEQAHSFNRTIKNVHISQKGGASSWAKEQAERIIALVESCGGSEVLLQRYDSNVASLDFSSDHTAFEKAMENLGCYLGFESKRADDNGLGSDVYWVSQEAGFGLVIEAKNEKGQETPLHKEEAGQLRTARDWLMQERSDLDIQGVSAHPNYKADHNASAENLFALTPNNLKQLIDDARCVLIDAMRAPEAERMAFVSTILDQRNMGLRDIMDKYFVHFETA